MSGRWRKGSIRPGVCCAHAGREHLGTVGELLSADLPSLSSLPRHTGIGLMGAKALAANGAKVYITGRRQEKLDEAVKNTDVGSAGGSLHAIPMDVTNKESIQAAVEKIKEQEKFISM